MVLIVHQKARSAEETIAKTGNFAKAEGKREGDGIFVSRTVSWKIKKQDNKKEFGGASTKFKTLDQRTERVDSGAVRRR